MSVTQSSKVIRPRVEATALPLRWREPAEKRERLGPTLAKGAQRCLRIVAEILPLLRPAVRVEWQAIRLDETPCREVSWHVAQGEHFGLVHGQHGPKPQDELLFNVAQMADHFFG
jgi:hypothetical protein